MRNALFLVASLTFALVPLSVAERAAAAPTQVNYTYLEAKIRRVEGSGATQKLILDVGKNQRVFEGSTGLIYVGQSKAFMADGEEKIRFEVKKVGDAESEAVIFQGDADAKELAENPRVVLRASKVVEACGPRGTVDGQRIDGCVVERIRKWDAVIERVAKEKDLDANLIRGVIAAESGGDEKEVSPSGYKGLMQSTRNEADLDGEKSIQSGASNLKDKEKALRIRLKGEGIDLDTLSADAKLDAILAAYNAGQVTVHYAIKYAAAAGDKNKWADVAPFTRAALNTGAYNSKAALHYCAASTSKADAPKLVADAEAARRKLVGKELTEAQASAEAPALTVCAARFKATFSPRYRVRINAYRHYFEQAKKDSK